ncbi:MULTISPECIES: hypothetical protein [Zoogloea]|uniref:Uncharacterized protein n=1 Tax=Zoogloea oleivorans TaxID=1552750 RepID=A0A6C2CJL6_9RHOO|nr:MULTISPECIES: hypothetical protein [Zoogloea]MBT9496866.1 hypothetical protein [Zoogloea sp.]MDD2669970.1 hypothetical protein [Zoogloea sp.]MDY0037922.1 hypothetical protein [Zoogloea oleivorans]TYC54360.1 hypothetical protein ETQ85_19225 [Zoogloea oleivorans]
MEVLICRILLASGLVVGVLLAGGQGEQALAPVLLVLLGVALLRRIAPSLPWRLGHGRRYY